MRRHYLSPWFFRVSLVVIVILTDCSKDNLVPSIGSDFSEYVNRFAAEGKARNVSVDIHNVIVEYVSQLAIKGAPYCGQSLGGPPHIQIVGSSGCWTGQTDLNKEILLFHELGHAMLKRSHDDTTLPNGRNKSIMNSVYQFGSYLKFTPELRKYYLDELFDPSTPAPAWARIKTNSKVLLSDSISSNSSWTFIKNTSTHTGAVSNDFFISPHHSLSIQSPSVRETANFSYWKNEISPAGIPIGSEVVLKVKIKLVNVDGTGVSIALRADSRGETALFKTTENIVKISGSQDFKEYSINIQYFPKQVDRLYIFLLFQGPSAGTVYFDDVSIVNNY